MEKKKNVKLNIRKGDLVKVMAGDSKGQQGKVLQVILKDSRILVEGANMVSKHTKPNAANPNGGINKQEAPIHVSNIMLIDPKSGNATRISKKRDEKGRVIRIAKKSGEEIK
ncbi:50S ribosomal protein L24 [Pedobacter cryophilus]|jgi:large subunit ribosomal protein L24|uniref:Large ribosomal subunit protein uL24 n=1 Tax=Pedobacter cryophilus TaxID=2571271 RepID=A0A4U1BWL8_9SPHI|nr:50S ribosomal protein L24 [Pedobacter cryophilus]TKB96734.1 50S ribosomal protein L24 [Pedobacter cryophilus]